VAARREGAVPVDPRPYAVGTIKRVLEEHPSLESLIPAMGYGDAQVAELAATLEATPADLVLSATPIDLTRIMELGKPVVRVRYDLDEVDPESLRRPIATALERALHLVRT
jgi:predicted GTPase